MPKPWDQMTTDEKLEVLRGEAKDRAEQCNRIAAQLQELQVRLTQQILPMVNQIGDLTARVAALESERAGRKG